MTENEALKDDQVNSRSHRIWKKKRGGGGRTSTEVLMASTPLTIIENSAFVLISCSSCFP